MLLVWSGVDTFEISFWAVIPPEFMEKLKALKEKAQEEEVPQPIGLAGLEFLVQAKGIAHYPYLLKSEDLHVRLSGRLSGACISVRGESVGLVAYGHGQLFALAEEVVREIAPSLSGAFSRLDVAVDVQGFVPTLADYPNFVCRAKKRELFCQGDELQGMRFGEGDMVFRIYNKTQELPESGKEWFRTVWAQCPGYNPEKDVWRFESQMRREMLKEIGCTAPADAFARLPRILGTALAWCELRVPDGVTKTRWPLDPRWEALKEASFAGQPLPRVRKEGGVANLNRLLDMIKGCTVSVAAQIGEKEFEDAWPAVGAMIAARVEFRGVPFPELVEKRRRQLV
jgi:hypothetical protein